MIWIVFLFLWWLTGQAIFLHVCYLINPTITVKDLLFSIIAGPFGPFGIVFYSTVKEFSWLDTVIYRGRRK